MARRVYRRENPIEGNDYLVLGLVAAAAAAVAGYVGYQKGQTTGYNAGIAAVKANPALLTTTPTA